MARTSGPGAGHRRAAAGDGQHGGQRWRGPGAVAIAARGRATIAARARRLDRRQDAAPNARASTTRTPTSASDAAARDQPPQARPGARGAAISGRETATARAQERPAAAVADLLVAADGGGTVQRHTRTRSGVGGMECNDPVVQPAGGLLAVSCFTFGRAARATWASTSPTAPARAPRHAERRRRRVQRGVVAGRPHARVRDRLSRRWAAQRHGADEPRRVQRPQAVRHAVARHEPGVLAGRDDDRVHERPRHEAEGRARPRAAQPGLRGLHRTARRRRRHAPDDEPRPDLFPDWRPAPRP